MTPKNDDLPEKNLDVIREYAKRMMEMPEWKWRQLYQGSFDIPAKKIIVFVPDRNFYLGFIKENQIKNSLYGTAEALQGIDPSANEIIVHRYFTERDIWLSARKYIDQFFSRGGLVTLWDYDQSYIEFRKEEDEIERKLGWWGSR